MTQPATTPRNLVVCMDGTGNAPKASGNTNVLRLFSMLENSDHQLTFYSPGVGSRGDPAALTVGARVWTKLRGLVTGYGMRRDISEAYTFLVHNYRPGDRIYIFGFSRGAFASLALAGLLRLYGLLRPESANMIGDVVKRISRPAPRKREVDTYKFRGFFSRRIPDQADDAAWFGAVRVHFVGLFDTVKALKYFKLLTRLREDALPRWYHPSWPFTSGPEFATTMRHAVSIDDRRIPYDVWTVRPDEDVDFEEVWFAGVHSDIGGGFEDRDSDSGSLGRITLKWMAEAALARDLRLDPDASDDPYDEYCTVDKGDRVDSDGQPHRNGFIWLLVGLRRRLARRPFRRWILSRPFWQWFSRPDTEEIRVHQSVYDRTEGEEYLHASKTIAYVAADKEWKQRRPVVHIEPGQSLPQPTSSGARANLAVSLFVWWAALAVFVAVLSTWVGVMHVMGSDGMNLSFWELLGVGALAPLGIYGMGSLTFAGWLPLAVFWVTAVTIALIWVALAVALFGGVVGFFRD